jgi:hypothetical protein
MTEIEEAKARLRERLRQSGASEGLGVRREELTALLAHVDRLEALSTPALVTRRVGPKGAELGALSSSLMPAPDPLAGALKEAARFEREEELDAAKGNGMDEGATFVIEHLAKLLGVPDYEQGDGSEDWHGDVGTTVFNVLCAGGIIDPETSERRALSTPAPDDPGQSSDGLCEDCGRRVPVWFAPNALWNRVKGGPEATDDPGGLLCPCCFIRRAETTGVAPTAWVLSPEAPAPDDPVERIVADIVLVANDWQANGDDLKSYAADYIITRIRAGDWKLPAPAAIPEAIDG